MTKKSKKVYVLHHRNWGTPESGEIHSIHSTKKGCLAAMKEELNDGYGGVTIKQNEEEHHVYMYWSVQKMFL